MQTLTERIRALEQTSRRLDPDAAARASWTEATVGYAEEFLDRLGTLAAYDDDASRVAELRALPFSDTARAPDEMLRLLRESVDAPGINPASGRHVGYIPGGGLYAAALGDYLAAVTNRYAGVRFASPGAVEMEDVLLDWMAELMGYPADCGGNLTTGGSIANLIAIVTARDAHGLRGRDYERAVVYLTGHAHHCVDKALRIAGMGECVRRYVAMDELYRMRADALEAAIMEDRAAGFLPWLVVASAGTTDVGAIDPLQDIGRLAREHGLWYHVDAAYGGFFALVDELQPRLAGMADSDSIVLDPHKGLFLPYGSGAVLVKDASAMVRSHQYQAAYMQDAISEAEARRSPADLSPELSKHFRGPRLWLPLLLHGLDPFRACLEEKLLLTRYFHERVAQLGFEVGPEPELSVSTYRWVPASGDADAFNRALLEWLYADGRVFLSSTLLRGRFTLRMAALAFRTHLEEIDVMLDVLAEAVRALGE